MVMAGYGDARTCPVDAPGSVMRQPLAVQKKAAAVPIRNLWA
jgi:hypothetical protein